MGTCDLQSSLPISYIMSCPVDLDLCCLPSKLYKNLDAMLIKPLLLPPPISLLIYIFIACMPAS